MTQQSNSSSNGKQDDSTTAPAHSSSRTFWATTGAATIVAAAIGATATLLANQPTQAPPTPPSSAAAPAHDANLASPGIAAARDSGVYWQGSFLMDSYVDFDSAPPHNGGGDLSQDIYGNLHFYNDGSVWEESAPPTKQQCSDQIATRAADEVPLEVGTQVCYRTRAGRVVYFKVTAITEKRNLWSNPHAEISVVVWKR